MSSLFVKKQVRKRAYRRRDSEEATDAIDKDDDNDQHQQSDGEKEEQLPSILADIRDLQRMRAKSSGLSAEELALGEQTHKDANMKTFGDDPLYLKTGGVFELKKMKRSVLDRADIEDDIKQQFSKESHLRDEDEEMRKFVEEELSRRTGNSNRQESASHIDVSSTKDANKNYDPEHILMNRAAERLKKFHSKSSEEMLSNQMLSGIPEVDLGIEARIKNIEETEAKKHIMLKEVMEKKRNLERDNLFKQNVVKDLSQNYVQHSIFFLEELTDLGQEDWKKKKKALNRPNTDQVGVAVVGDLSTPHYDPKAKPISTMTKQPSLSQLSAKCIVRTANRDSK